MMLLWSVRKNTMGMKMNKFHTAYIFGRNYDKMQRSSSDFRNLESAQGWADFLNEEEQDKPIRQRKKHFVVEIHGEDL